MRNIETDHKSHVIIFGRVSSWEEKAIFGFRLSGESIWDSELDCDIACCEGDGSIPREVRDANTKLIAAAPDLLEALRECSEALTSDAAISKRKELLERADKALAKAEGKE